MVGEGPAVACAWCAAAWRCARACWAIPNMGGCHAVFKALAGKGHLSRPPGLAAAGSAKTKDQSLQFPVIEIASNCLQKQGVGSFPVTAAPRLGGRVGARANVCGRGCWYGSLIETDKNERTQKPCAGRLASRPERTD